jgi:hypothetical protein
MSFKQPSKKEGGKAWAAFVAYRDLGNDRSYAKVSKQLGKSVKLMERWAKKFGWSNRIIKYEAYIQNQELHTLLDQKTKAKVSLLKQSQGIRTAAVSAMIKRIKAGKLDEEKIKDLMSMFKEAAIIEIKITGLEEGPLILPEDSDVNSFSFLKKIYDKVHNQDGIKKQVRSKPRKASKRRRTDTGKSDKTKGRKVSSSVAV